MENEEKTVLFDLKKQPLRSEREEKRNRRRKRFLVFMLCLFCLVLGMLLGVLFLNSARNVGSTSSAASVPFSSSPYNEIQRIMNRYWLYGDRYEDLDK